VNINVSNPPYSGVWQNQITVPVSGGSYSGTVDFAGFTMAQIRLVVWSSTSPYSYVDELVSTPCSSGGPGSGSGNWPGDDRVEPRPGDRIVVYCNAGNRTVTVFGVLDDSQGAFLATFKYIDILKAGGKGITKSVEPL